MATSRLVLDAAGYLAVSFLPNCQDSLTSRPLQLTAGVDVLGVWRSPPSARHRTPVQASLAHHRSFLLLRFRRAKLFAGATSMLVFFFCFFQTRARLFAPRRIHRATISCVPAGDPATSFLPALVRMSRSGGVGEGVELFQRQSRI